jgi:hypothetical protein
MRRSSYSLIVLLLAIGCARQAVHKENVVALPVVLPLKMCAQPGTVSVSLGDVGERMLCERQLPLGSHLPLCVCRDEGMIAQQSRETQELVRQIEMESPHHTN